MTASLVCQKCWFRITANLALIVFVCFQSLFPQDLVDHERIRAQFTSALNSMNHAVEGRSVPAWQQAHMEAQPQSAPAQTASYSAYAAPGPAMQAPGQYMAAEEELTLRQLVESFAAENDIQLLPKAGQLEEGLQVCAATLLLFVAQAALTQASLACASKALMPAAVP